MQEQPQEPYSLFIYGLNSPVTRERYTTRLRKFFTFLGIEGEMRERSAQFVARAKKDQEWTFSKIVSFLQTYKDRVDKKEISGSTIRNYTKAIKLFCEMNDILLPWKKITRGLPRGRKWANDRAPSLSELRKIIEYPDRRLKPIVYIMVSSGIRRGAWDFLKWGHVKPIERNGQIVAASLLVYAGEEDEEYTTFLTPEAYNALKDWMDFREKSGEKLTKDSWLMRNLWDNKITNGKGWPNAPRKLKPSGIKSLVENALVVQGIRTKLANGKRRHEFQGLNGMRKYFKSRAEQIMKPINTEVLMGHSTGVSDSYYRPTQTEMLDDYLKAVPLLTISEVAEVKREMVLQEQKHQLDMKSVMQKFAEIESRLGSAKGEVVSGQLRVVSKDLINSHRSEGT